MAVPQQLVELEDCQENWEYAQSRLFDTGDIKTSIKNADHAGWLLCNARAMTGGGALRTLLLQLASPFGVSGADPLLPEGREKVFVGAGATHALGASFGSAASNMPAHVHTESQAFVTATLSFAAAGADFNVANATSGNTGSAGSGSATDGNYPPSVAVNYFIHI